MFLFYVKIKWGNGSANPFEVLTVSLACSCPPLLPELSLSSLFQPHLPRRLQ